jgi:uncharacterized membrane protein
MKFLQNILIIALLFTGYARSQDVSFTAEGPSVVEVGEQFMVNFTLNARPSSFAPPDMKDFIVLSGPNQSTSSSFQIINGRSSQSITITYTYYLQSSNPGTFIIQPATAVISKKEYASNSLSIEVVGTKSQTQPVPQEEPSAALKEVSNEDIYVRVITDKASVYQGEHIIATLKLYTRLPISGFGTSEMPDFADFWTKDIESPTEINLQRENVGGVIYNTGIIRKVILFPQKTGDITIEPFKLETYVRQQINTPRSIFDDFFGPSYTNVSKMLESKPVVINVKALPAVKPTEFSGAVGSMNMESEIDKTNINTNDAVTIKIRIKGNGNLNLVEAPKIDFPPDFDTFDPKINSNINNSASGQTGSKTFEYLIIPRHAGNYRIPPVVFSYFDLNKKQYQTLTTNEFKISVAKGTEEESAPVVSGGLSKEELKILGSDILFIKPGPFKLYPIGKVLFGSVQFFTVYAGSFILFLFIILFRRAHIKKFQNEDLVRNRRANKIARKRLRQAAVHLKQNETESFYESVLKALWGYLSDKLNIPVSELSRETVEKNLSLHIEDTTLTIDLIRLIDVCEMARFAPFANVQEMDKVYTDSVKLITKLEQNIR